MNNVSLFGSVSRDVTMRETKSGMLVAYTSIAVRRQTATQDGQDVDFIPIVLFGKKAEWAASYLQKGLKITVSGRISVSTHQTDDRWITYFNIIAENVEFAESKETFKRRTQRNDFEDTDMNVDSEISFL